MWRWLLSSALLLAARVGTMVTPSGRLSIPAAEVPTLTAEVVAALAAGGARNSEIEVPMSAARASMASS